MAIVYYPKDSIILRRDTISASYEQLELDLIPNAIFYFGPNLSALSNSLLQVTSSWAKSSSYSITASYALNGGGSSLSTGSFYPITSSWSDNSNSASYALTASYALNAGTLLNTGSLYFITVSWANNSITSSYALTASYALNAGTLLITGSTYPITSSWSNNSNSSSHSDNSNSSSYALTSSFSLTASYVLNAGTLLITGSLYPITSSWSNNTISSSYALTASYSLTSSTSSYALNAGTLLNTGSTYPITSSWSELSVTSSFASSAHESFSSSYSIISLTADFALIAGTSITSTTASYVRTGSRAITASYADTAGNSGTILNTGSSYPITSSWSNNSKSASYYNQLWLNTGSTYPITSSWSSTSLSSSFLKPGANIYLSQSYISSNISNSVPSHTEGLMFWDSSSHTYAIYSDIPTTTLQIGQENWFRTIASETIPNGYAVYISGSINNLPISRLALADGTRTKNLVVGVATHTISSGSQGWITTNGIVHDADTSTWPAGSILYLSDTISGSYRTDPPSEPKEKVIVGRSAVSNVSIGQIYVNITIIPELPIINVGMVSIPSISTGSVNATGSIITIGTGSANFCTTADGLGVVRNYQLSSASFALTSSFLDTQYITADYNNGNPHYNIVSDKSSLDNIQTVIVYTLLMGAGGVVSYSNWDSPGILLANKDHQRVISLRGIERESGFNLSESGSRGIDITAGLAWQGIKQISLSSVNSSTNRFVLVAHSASVWSGSIITQFINNLYDDGTNLVSLGGGNHWTVNWVYRAIGSQNSTLILLGNDYTKLTDAISSQPPTPPTELHDVAFLVGRAIYKSGITTAEQIDSAFVQTFTPAGITTHNSLDGLQGGQSGEYYHLTSASYAQFIAGGSGILISGSTYNITSSWATTASYALTSGNGGSSLVTGSTYPITSSWSNNSQTASYYNQLWLNTGSSYLITSSWSNNSTTSSYSSTASYALNSTPSLSASYASTSSTVVGQNTNTLWIPAAAMTANTTSGSTAGTLEYGNDRVMLSYQSFAKTSQQTAQFSVSMPKTWDVGTITGQFVWTTAFTGSVATGSVVWALGGGSVSQNDNLNFTFGTTQSVVSNTGTGNTYTSSYFHYTSSRLSAVTIGGSPQPEDTIWFKVYRNALNSSDTLTGSAALLGIKLLIGTTAINDL